MSLGLCIQSQNRSNHPFGTGFCAAPRVADWHDVRGKSGIRQRPIKQLARSERGIVIRIAHQKIIERRIAVAVAFRADRLNRVADVCSGVEWRRLERRFGQLSLVRRAERAEWVGEGQRAGHSRRRTASMALSAWVGVSGTKRPVHRYGRDEREGKMRREMMSI